MNLNVNALANAAAVSMAILWIICSLLFMLLPGQMATAMGHMMHTPAQTHGWVITGTGFIVGLIIWAVIAWISGWLIATFYNRFTK